MISCLSFFFQEHVLSNISQNEKSNGVVNPWPLCRPFVPVHCPAWPWSDSQQWCHTSGGKKHPASLDRGAKFWFRGAKFEVTVFFDFWSVLQDLQLSYNIIQLYFLIRAEAKIIAFPAVPPCATPVFCPKVARWRWSARCWPQAYWLFFAVAAGYLWAPPHQSPLGDLQRRCLCWVVPNNPAETGKNHPIWDHMASMTPAVVEPVAQVLKLN